MRLLETIRRDLVKQKRVMFEEQAKLARLEKEWERALEETDIGLSE